MAAKDPGETGAGSGANGKKGGGNDSAPKSAGLQLLESAGQKLVPLIVSAGGLIGFVAFAGSVVLWSRFFAIHVPPEQVVAAVPKGESIAVGSVMLLLFGFFGALATLAVYLIDRGGRATPGMSRALLAILTIEAAIAIWIAGDSPVQVKVIASEVLAIAFVAALWSTYVGGLIKLDDGLPGLGERKEPTKQQHETPFWKPGNKTDVKPLGALVIVIAAVGIGGIAFAVAWQFGASPNWRWIIALGVGAAVLVSTVAAYCWRFSQEKKKKERKEKKEKEEKKEQEERKRKSKGLVGKLVALWQAHAPQGCHGCGGRPCTCRSKGREKGAERDDDDDGKPPQFELTLWGSAVMAMLAAIGAAVPSVILGEWWVGVSLAIVFVIGCGLWRIAWLAKKRFIWLGLAVFISVPLFGALMLMVRNLAEPQVQALALIRSSDGPDEAIQGLYVTETSERVYFANVATEGCSDEVEPAGGRLLWVPKSEVVAMSIGPLEDVEDAGKTALEMAYALTPAVETPAGDHVSLTPPEERIQRLKGEPTSETTKESKPSTASSAEKKGEGPGEKKGASPEETKVAIAPLPEGRLEDPGPAVRPNFGAGLRLDPETASPGEEVTLSMSAPNPGVKGFGTSRAGRNLRLGGVIADIAKEAAPSAATAEYVEVGSASESGEERLLHLAKESAYVLEGDDFVSLKDAAAPDGRRRYLRLKDPALREVNGEPVSGEEEVFVKVHKRSGRVEVTRAVHPKEEARMEKKTGAKLATQVTLAAGEFEGKSQPRESIELRGLPLYRQAWHENQIKFRVPENAKSGVITVECGQLAGSPLLRVSHAPTARIAVRMQAGSSDVSLSSAGSDDEDHEGISRSWMVEGMHRGHRSKITVPMPLRSGAYSIKLTVADEAGNVDTATLRLMRLPDAMFEFGKSQPDEQSDKSIDTARESLENAIEATTPVAIELDGHADNPGAASFNLGLSLERAEEVRDRLASGLKLIAAAASLLPVEEVAYGEDCPIDSGPGRDPLNRRVEVFVLDEGVTIKPAKGCSPGRLKRTTLDPLSGS